MRLTVGHHIRLQVTDMHAEGGELVVVGVGDTGRGLRFDAHVVEVSGDDGVVWASTRQQLALPGGAELRLTYRLRLVWDGVIQEVAGRMLVDPG